MNSTDPFMDYFWLISIVLLAVNYVVMTRFSSVSDDAGVNQAMLRRYAAWMCGLLAVPWIVLGCGQVLGKVHGVLELFRLQDGNPFVWGFYAAALLVQSIAVYWVFFRDGARIASELRLVTFHTPVSRGAVSPFWIKIMAIASLVFLAIFVWVASHVDLPMH